MPKYADVSVSKNLLERLKKEQNEAVGMARYGRFKAWLHYANLQSWQGQGWHFNYLNYNGVEWHCTCGLVTLIGSEPEVQGFAGLTLDHSHRARGHRNLPSLIGECVAFIYDYEWMEGEGVYFYKALCQVCGSHTELMPGKGARWFVDEHNKSCLSVVADNFQAIKSEEQGHE
jgi:hypothetical protein